MRDKKMTKTEALNYLNKSPRAKLVYYSCLAEPLSFKQLMKEWYPTNLKTNVLNQKELKKTLLDHELIKPFVFKSEHLVSKDYREKFFISNLEYIPELFIVRSHQDDMIKEIAENKDLLIKYFEQSVVRDMFSLENVKTLFNNDHELIGKYGINMLKFFAIPSAITMCLNLFPSRQKRNLNKSFDKFAPLVGRFLTYQFHDLVLEGLNPADFIKSVFKQFKEDMPAIQKLYIPKLKLFQEAQTFLKGMVGKSL